MNWYDCYVGVPFVDRGREIDGFDCWGLVRHAYSKHLNIELPSYGDVSASDLRRVSRSMTDGDSINTWHPVSGNLKPFDIVAMTLYTTKLTAHVGLMIDSRRLIHTELSSHTCIVDRDHLTVIRRIVGFRRHVSQL